jgi:predicted kinase
MRHFQADPGSGPQLVVFTGLPATGKSTLAQHAAAWLRAPLFSKDELEATLWRSGIGRELDSGYATYELLTTLAEGQLARTQSVILDSVATVERFRAPWRLLAARYGAPMRVIETLCSDENLHRARLSSRLRQIPGWPELSWMDIERVRGNFEPWTVERLQLDAARPLDENLAALREYIAGV